MPRVSVILPVRDGEAYVQAALESILTQTFKDFEVLIIDDCSRDGTAEILRSYQDSRIQILRNTQPLGLSKSLNFGISQAAGRYIARMDHDDVSLPRRLQMQVEYLEHNPTIDLVGTWARTKGLSPEQSWRYPSSHDDICSEMLFNSTLVHSSVMWRMTKFNELGLRYSEDVDRAQDYELWARAAAKGVKFANLAQILLKYRIHDRQVGNQFGSQQAVAADSVRKNQIKKLGLRPSDAELQLHLECARWKFPENIENLRHLEGWLLRLKRANDEVRLYASDAIARTLEARWWAACRVNARLGKEAWKLYLGSSLAEPGHGFVDKAMFFLKSGFYGNVYKRSAQ